VGVRAHARRDRALALRIVVANANPPDRERLESRLARAANACGCSTGSIALVAALLGAGAWWLVALDGRLALWPEAALAGLLILGATLVGKLTGLAAADAWLWWVGRRFRQGTAPAGGWTQVP
jgi:hypothetical protein